MEGFDAANVDDTEEAGSGGTTGSGDDGSGGSDDDGNVDAATEMLAYRCRSIVATSKVRSKRKPDLTN